MKVLIVGSGGREHIICKAVAKSPLCEKLYCTPGNAGIAKDAECWSIAPDKIAKIVAAAREYKIDFVIIGPESPLALGLADELAAAGISCFGPSKRAAELESSKGFMKDFCARVGIPTAKYKRFAEVEDARAYVAKQKVPVVVKADGLAAGKGVTIARTIEEAIAAVNDAMVGQVFGPSGEEVVIEDFMEGEEASFFALCDGKTARFFATAQDHKAVFDGDKGPNTGGMGAYSPASMINEAMKERIMREIINPTVAEMKKIGRPYSGVLFAGLMMTKTGPKLIEYNARFGDPETEVIIPRLKSDLLELLYSCSKGKLDKATIEWEDKAALGVVMAADGYPGHYLKGSVIRGLDRAESIDGVTILHAGTLNNAAGEIISNGGRVLCVTAVAPTIAEAQKRAYQAVDQIDWPEGFCRRDIGWRALSRKNRT
jgi:phosphoribosylamine---glycine ligase